MQVSLARLAPRQADNPRVVFLTPGPYSETYCEQSYLARYLGYMLVEGQDLTVRDDRVYLKTLSGLEPVDVIFRRVDDDFCDPLELRNDSILGVPGLLEALRAGNVAVANAPGAGLAKPSHHGFFCGAVPAFAGRKIENPLRRHRGGADRNRPGNTFWKIWTACPSIQPFAGMCRSRSLIPNSNCRPAQALRRRINSSTAPVRGAEQVRLDRSVLGAGWAGAAPGGLAGLSGRFGRHLQGDGRWFDTRGGGQ